MLFRKIITEIEEYLRSDEDKILVIEGARQIGKSFIIRDVGKRLYKNFVEINFANDDEGRQVFKDVKGTQDFYLALGMVAGKKLSRYDDTLVFIDEIQHYPQFLTMLKFLREERRYRFIASGSMLGIALRLTTSIPVGSIIRKEMYQLDFEEFLWANGYSVEAIEQMRRCYNEKQCLSPQVHEDVMSMFRRYLLVGGMPDAVNAYLETHNIVKVRAVQNAIHNLYKEDASKYEESVSKKLYVRRIYELVPSQMENKKKRIVAKSIRDLEKDRFDKYTEEFEYLISSGIALNVNAISNPKYPLSESVQKNLLKLYLNDVGMLTAVLYGNNLQPILNDTESVNLGAVYESVVAQELRSHGHKLFYYDNRSKGEVDFLVNSVDTTAVLPIEVKSGKDYLVHSALNNLLSNDEYGIKEAVVLSNTREVKQTRGITYMPVYNVMFIKEKEKSELEYLF